MVTTSFAFTPVRLFTFLFVGIVTAVMALSCQKEVQPPQPLVDQRFSHINLHSGSFGNIGIQATDWQLDYVRMEGTDENLLDTSGLPLQLHHTDTIVAANGWIRLAKVNDGGGLFLDLKENFSTTPRSIIIGLIANGNSDQIRVTQRRGKSYRLIDSKFSEIDSLRRIYTSDQECTPIVLSNNTNEMKIIETKQLFQNVRHVNTFESDDYEAFDWVGEKDSLLFMPDLMIDGSKRWSGRVRYQKGTHAVPYWSETGSQTLFHVEPHTHVSVFGEMTYAERTGHYTLTIRNEESGHQFDVSGRWKQTLPFVPHYISF